MFDSTTIQRWAQQESRPMRPPIDQSARRFHIGLGAAVTAGAVLIWIYVIVRGLIWAFT